MRMRKKAWNFYYQDGEAFTLFEIILVIIILGILMGNILKVFSFINKYIYESKIKDQNIGRINRSLEYISYELRRSDNIERLEDQKDYSYFISKYPDNIGILIKIKEANTNLYISYCLDGDKLRRMSFRTVKNKLTSLRSLEGYNLLADHIYGLEETEYDEENMYINIKLKIDEKGGVKIYNRFINLYGDR